MSFFRIYLFLSFLFISACPAHVAAAMCCFCSLQAFCLCCPCHPTPTGIRTSVNRRGGRKRASRQTATGKLLIENKRAFLPPPLILLAFIISGTEEQPSVYCYRSYPIYTCGKHQFHFFVIS